MPHLKDDTNGFGIYNQVRAEPFHNSEFRIPNSELSD